MLPPQIHPMVLDGNFHEDRGSCLAPTPILHHGARPKRLSLRGEGKVFAPTGGIFVDKTLCATYYKGERKMKGRNKP